MAYLGRNTSYRNKQGDGTGPQGNPSLESAQIRPDTTQNQVLPIEQHKKEICDVIATNNKAILVGETGSGKTTRTPLYLMESFSDAKIAITSPRVFPARSVSRFVANSSGGVVGGEVGLWTRNEKKVSKDTRATFMTDGILLNLLRQDEMLLSLDIVMVDEAHERTINIDLLLGLLKRAQKLREERGEKPLKVMVASATLEEEKFADYFDSSPVVKVPGRLHPVDVKYIPPDPLEGNLPMSSRVAEVVKSIVESKDQEGDILVFLPGEDDINRAIEEIRRRVSSEDVALFPLFGMLDAKDQDSIFAPNAKRKVIVSTNIAETSVTIDGVRHVIDSGEVKEMVYDPRTGINALKVSPCSQANMNQRMGRAGRTAPGTCYRLMPKAEFDNREKFQRPEIFRKDLAEVVLRMKEMGIDDVEHFDFIDPPSSHQLHEAVEQLKRLEALDASGKITDIGREMFALQVRPDLARMLIEAKHLGVVPQMVDVVAMLSPSKPVFVNPNKNEPNETKRLENEKRLSAQSALRVPRSDSLTMLNVWKKYVESGMDKQFAYDHLLNSKSLEEVKLIRLQLLRVLGEAGISNGGQDDKEVPRGALLQCILSAVPDALLYCPGYKKINYKSFEFSSPLQEVRIFPGSACFYRGDTLLVALNIQQSAKKDRYGYTEEVTYARVCDTFSLEEATKILPKGWITEVPSGEPRMSYSGSMYQSYQIRIKGVPFTSLEKEITSLDAKVPRLIAAAHYTNQRILRQVNEYYRRSGKVEVNESILSELYKDVIKGKGLTTEEEVISNQNAFTLHIEDLLPEKEREKIDKDCPEQITDPTTGRTFSVIYTRDLGGRLTASVGIHTPTEVKAFSKVLLPSFSTVSRLVFTYGSRSFATLSEVQVCIEEEKRMREELIRQAEAWRRAAEEKVAQLNRDREEKNTEQRALDKERKDREKAESKPVKVEKTQEELKKEWVDKVTIFRDLLPVLRSIVEGKNEKFFKDKQKVIDRSRELRTTCNAMVSKLQESGDLDESTKGELSTLERNIITLFKRAEIGGPDVVISSIVSMEAALVDAARRNEVDIDESLLAKIRDTSLKSVLKGSKTSLTADEADGVLIELV